MELTAVKVDVQDTLDVPVTFDDEGTPIEGFEVVGPDSHQYQDADRKWRLRSVKRAASRGRPVDSRSENGAAEVLNTTLAVQREIVFACVVGMYGFTDNGVPAEVNVKTLDVIFTARPSWLTKVYMAIEANVGFTPV